MWVRLMDKERRKEGCARVHGGKRVRDKCTVHDDRISSSQW